MAIERQIRVETSIGASVDAVWARVSDHEATSSGFVRQFEGVLQRGLDELKRQLEAPPAPRA